MIKLILLLFVSLNLSINGLCQESHLSLIYDFEGEDFEHSVNTMIGTNDSLYIISNSTNGYGVFFRIDENGGGYKVIHEFEKVNQMPSSLVGNDTVIYGTTRFSSNYGGTLFKYSLKDYTFEFIADFHMREFDEVQVKYITDSVLWLTSFWSSVDEGSIFTIEKDGTNIKKIYNDTNLSKGQNPVDFIFHGDSIYIACYNGGGIPYFFQGSEISSGSVIRIKSDGTGYQNIIQGGDAVGTQPRSLFIRDNKLYGNFAYSGSTSRVGGQLFRSNLDGTSYDSLGALEHRVVSNLLITDTLIYGLSSAEIFGLNPLDGEIRIFGDILKNPDHGWDMVASPAYLNGNVYITAQQGGPNFGGTILKWVNKPPKINDTQVRRSQYATEIVLNELFTDPEGDSLTYEFKFNKELVAVKEVNGKLIISTIQSGDVDIKITAKDGWGGYTDLTLSFNLVLSNQNFDNSTVHSLLFPNPTNAILNLSSELVERVEVLSLHGKLIKSYPQPGIEIDISALKNGVYLVRYFQNGKAYSQKVIKN